MAGRRAACAALVVAAKQAASEQGMIPRRQSVVIAFVVEQELSGRGLGTIAHAMGPFEETVVVDGAGSAAPMPAERWPSLGRVTVKPLAARYAGTPVETVALADAERLAAELASWIGASR
jgi:hypothetical protein